MPDRLDRLVGDALDDLRPVDLSVLAHRARRRRRSRRGALLASACSLVVALAVMVVAPGHDDESQRVITGPTETMGFVLTGDPVGRWTQVDDLPIAPRLDAFTAPLDDGRVLVWGGVPWSEADPGSTPLLYPDGAILSPGDGSWEVMAPMPIRPGVGIIGPSGGMVFTVVDVVNGRLAVVGNGLGNVMSAGVYDIATGEWTMAPEQSDLDGYVDGAAWDGTTIVLVRTAASTVDGESLEAPGPFTRRWSPGQTSWSEGEPPPLSARSGPGAEAANGRLAIWGGIADARDAGTDASPDGAIYDIAANAWVRIPPTSLLPPQSNPLVTWRGDLLLAGAAPFSSPPVEDGGLLSATYDPSDQTWRRFDDPPSLPDDDPPDTGSTRLLPAVGLSTFVPTSRSVVAIDNGGSPGAHAWFLAGRSWEQAPYTSIAEGGELTVSFGAFDDRWAKHIAVRAAPGRWHPGVDAPMDRAWIAGEVTSDDQFVVLAGPRAGDQNATWIFDPGG